MNCKNHCCNQFGERHLIQAHIDKLQSENERLNQALNQQITMNADLQEENMLLRQELDQKDERIFVANKCRSRNEHFDSYKTAQDIRMDIIARNGNDGEHYE